MRHTEEEVYQLIDECLRNINEGEVNAAGSYDEDVKDALFWLMEGGPRPEIGREV